MSGAWLRLTKLCCNRNVNLSASGAGSSNVDLRALTALTAEVAKAGLHLPALSNKGAEFDRVSLSLGQLANSPIRDLLQVVDAHVEQQAELHRTVSIHSASEVVIHASGFSSQDLPYGFDGMAFTARDTAEKSVGRAAQAIETAGESGHRIPENLDPRAVLMLANQFIETGQLSNYNRAAELGRIVFAWYEEPHPGYACSRSDQAARRQGRQVNRQFHNFLKSLWRRAPLLVLLAIWLLGGIVSGVVSRMLGIPAYKTELAFDVWVAGLPGLVVFQFIATIRGSILIRPPRR